MPCSLVGIAQFAEIVAVYNRTNHHGSRALQRLTYIPLMAGNAGLALNMPASIIASARTDRESKPYDHAAISNVPASKHNRHGRRNNRRHAYNMAVAGSVGRVCAIVIGTSPCYACNTEEKNRKNRPHPSGCPSLPGGSHRGVINNSHTSMVFGLGSGFTCLT